ncbi:MAG: hypothetical protein ACU0CO_07230 [Shimia sp.]
MENRTNRAASASVADMPYEDFVCIDPAARLVLTERLGVAGAEGVICRTMEEVANRLSLIERCYHQGDRAALTKALAGTVEMAEQVGLHVLAQVARDVSDCAQGTDPVALAATLARLTRVGDRALTAAWDTPGMSV